MSTRTIVIASGSRFQVPRDCTSATIECIGAGNVAGGAYSKTNSLALTPGSFFYVQVGYYGFATWLNKNANNSPTTTTEGCLATGGGGTSVNGTYNISGGAAIDCVGDVRYDGGGARAFYDCGGCNPATFTPYSFGGAAGPNGAGGNGLQSGTTYGGGGGANGGGNGTSTAGGTNRLGTGGGTNNGGNGSNGGGGGPNGAAGTGLGSYDPIYTDSFSGLTYGPSSGAGASASTAPTAVTRGAGGGAYGGTNGLIIFTYTPTTLTPGTYTQSIVGENSSNGIYRWIPPAGVTSVFLEGVGTPGGIVTSVNKDGAYYVSSTVAAGILSVSSYSALPWYVNRNYISTGTSTPTTGTTGIVISDTASGGSGNIGQTVYAGGAGGTSYTIDVELSETTIAVTAGGGGGGSAGPAGPGSAGGAAYSGFDSTSDTSRGGGGGAAVGAGQTAGSAATSTTGGDGGTRTGGSGGTGGTSVSPNGGAGTNGGGGGGAYGTGIIGTSSGPTIWTDSFTSATYSLTGGTGGGFNIGGGSEGQAIGGGISVGGARKGAMFITFTIPSTNTGNMLMMFR